MGYFLVLILLIYGIGKIVAFFSSSRNSSSFNQANKLRQTNRVSDSEINYHNFQMAISQHNHPAEQFFFMGMIDSAGEKEISDDNDAEEDYGYYEEPESYDEFDEE